jgi:hypothetical protein
MGVGARCLSLREWDMWLALTAIVLAAFLGFNVLAVAVQYYDG